MARLQILELPAGSGDDRPPFVLVIDEYQPRRYILGAGQTEQTVDEFDGIAERIGARAVLTFVETIDIPKSDPHPSEAAEEAQTLLPNERARAAEDELKKYEIRQRVDGETRGSLAATLGLDGPRRWDDIHHAVTDLQQELADARMWARHGYEIGQKHCGWSDHGVAPDWLTEGWPNHFDSCEHLKQAAGYDEALTRVRGLHRPVEYHGRTICAECSGYGGQSTDNAPVDHDKCDTLLALVNDRPTTSGADAVGESTEKP